MKKGTRKLLFWLVGISLFVILFLFIFEPAFVSMKLACYPQFESDWEVAGETSFEEDGSVIITYYEGDTTTLKHEYIHYKQFLRNERNAYCGIFGIRRFFIETEAYTGSYLPDFVYERVYGDYDG